MRADRWLRAVGLPPCVGVPAVLAATLIAVVAAIGAVAVLFLGPHEACAQRRPAGPPPVALDPQDAPPADRTKVRSAATGAAADQVAKHVEVGFYVYNIRDVDIAASRFAVDLYMWVKFPGEGAEFERFEFVNGRIDKQEEQERRFEDGITYVTWKLAATFQARYDLADFPFDRQNLEMYLEHPALESDDLVYHHDERSYMRTLAPQDRWGIMAGLSVPGWRITKVTRRVEDMLYETDFGLVTTPRVGSRYSRLVLSIGIERIAGPYVLKLLVPLGLILGVAYLVFFIPPHELQTSALLAVVALLACVAFQTTVSAGLPTTGYLLVSDKLFSATLALIFVTLCETILTHDLARAGRQQLAYRIEVAMRVVFPIAYVAAVAYILIGALGR